MQPVHVPPARRHLLDRPQRLGFLPTLWFWNDHERHRLALPLVLSLSLPLVPLLFFLVVRFQLPFSLFVVVNTLAPYVAMGVIERYIRRELRRRRLVGPEGGEQLVLASPSDLATSARPPSSRVYLALAALGGVGTAFAVGQLWGAAAAAVSVLVLVMGIGAAWRLSPRTPELPPTTRGG